VPFIDRDRVSIHYELHGEASPLPPLLLTHAFSATAAMWQPNVAALSSDRLVVTWDIRGHGDSDSPTEQALYSEALSVEDMAALLGVVDAGPSVVGGLSLGGYLSLALYLAHPELVAALLLCDCGPGFRRDEPRAEWNAMAERWAVGFEEKGLDALADRAEVRAGRHHSATGLALAARGILKQFDARVIESLPGIDVPTLVVVGSRDRQFLAAADVLASKIPGATKVVIDGAGHASNMDRPRDFDAAVRSLLEAL
jgi:pimeloyl-ACP methyl ester carboxylesterase